MITVMIVMPMMMMMLVMMMILMMRIVIIMTRQVRTQKRTNDFMLPSLSVLVATRLPEDLLRLVESSAPHTPVTALHPNWRVARYSPGETFPAHYDNSDTITVATGEGGKERMTSSHTLLIALSDR